MSDQQPHTDYPELIARYLSGNATDAEVRQLEDWVLADPDHKTQFTAFKKAWLLGGMQDTPPAIDVDRLWAQTSQHLKDTPQEARVRPLPTRNRWLRVAAAVVVLAGVSVWALLNFGGKSAMSVSTTDQTEDFALSDGTQVTLNQYSDVVYEPDKATQQRRLQLTGDAFFDVNRDESRPFIIDAAGVEIEVLGTSFYVDARDDQPEVQVIVQSGTVAVRAPGQEQVVLQAEQKAVFRKAEGSLTAGANDDPNYLAIKTDTLIFDDSPLEEVIFALNRQFHVNIESQITDSSNCGLDTSYEKYPLNDILDLLAATLQIQVERQGSRIILSGAGCNR